MVKEIKYSEGTESLLSIYNDDDYAGEEEIAVYFPKSLRGINMLALTSYEKRTRLSVFYAGTKNEWKNVKKGRLKIISVHDHYGEYYRNTYTEPQEKRIYYNWVSWGRDVVINCTDGAVFDSEKENAENPFEREVSDEY